MTKIIRLPEIIVIEDDAINHFAELFPEIIHSNLLIISGNITKDIAGNKIYQQCCNAVFSVFMSGDTQSVGEAIHDKVSFIKNNKIQLVVGVGGGKVIDFAKTVAYKAKVPYMVIPTSPSHDGIASPIVSNHYLKSPHSSFIYVAKYILIDTKIILNSAPSNHLQAGFGDVLANHTAILDWRLSYRINNEKFSHYAASLSQFAVSLITENQQLMSENMSLASKLLLQALVTSGVSMSIAGSSRPASGAEHLFSHALDKLLKTPKLHGLQCGLGAIIMSYLHNPNDQLIKNTLTKLGAPVTASQLGIDDAIIIEAILMAPTLRDRHTILHGNITKEKAVQAAKKTGVISE